MRDVSDLADYTVTAWVMENRIWRFLFDSSDAESVVQHELLGVQHWRMSELRDGIGVMGITLKSGDGQTIDYKIDTVCGGTIEVICEDVREVHIKRRSGRQ